MKLIELQATAKHWLDTRITPRGKAASNVDAQAEADLLLETALLAANVMNAEDAVESFTPCSIHRQGVARWEVIVRYESGIVVSLPTGF